MKNKLLFIFLASFCFAASFSQVKSIHTVTVKNTLDMQRVFETVEINKANLSLKSDDDFSKLKVLDVENKTILVSQFVDTNQDGVVDLLLFQPKINAKSQKQFKLVYTDKANKLETIDYCYSRFVPERIDDYAWENNRVAFRTYGPIAQEMVEKDIPGGTLSSGIDAWLKRVEYPIINKWYKKYTTKTGTYHKDTGEGLDNFHVGNSRGIGGIAIKTDSIYAFSENFMSWETITTGPIRTSFILNYKAWKADGKEIRESKLVSLDYGSNLSRFTISITGTDTIYPGITLHKKDGNITTNLKEGWLSYWEPLDDSEVGLGIVVPGKNMSNFEKYNTQKKDESNLYAQIKTKNNKAIYYAGFGWKKSLQFINQKEWEDYLSLFSKKLNNPLIIIYN